MLDTRVPTTDLETPLGATVDQVLSYLKSHAKFLHRRCGDGDPVAAARMRSLREFRVVPDEELGRQVKRRHALSVVARELGFENWPHLARILESGGAGDNFGTILCPNRMMAHQNIWIAGHEEAREVRQQHGGFLLCYRTQFLIVDADYVTELGLDPESDLWLEVTRDWAAGAAPDARARLYARLFAERLPAASSLRPEVRVAQ